MPKVKVSFVVLNWNGLEDTLNCLESLRKQTLAEYEIIVVDNGSSENQKNILREIADIILVDLPKNTGFTGGQIAALKYARGEFIALINNDAVVAKDWAEKAVEVMSSNKKIAAVGGRAYQWDPDKNQKPYDTSVNFYSYQVVNLVSGHTRTLTYGDKVCEVNSISGAGVLIRRSAIADVGYFDNDFFAYYEETDLFARFKRRGWKIVYSPKLKVWHQIAKSTRSNPSFYLFYMHRNRFRFAARNYDSPYFGKFLRFYIHETMRALIRILRSGRKNSIEEVALVKAAFWNLIYAFHTYRSRMLALAAGGHYSKLLLKDKAESIGIIIPCYNYAEHVAEAIESALNQTLPPDKIIVINDGSTDKSLEVIKRYKDSVVVIDQKNLGVIATKNRGLKEIGTDWVVFLDADDKFHPDYLKELYEQQRIYNVDVVYCGMRFIGGDTGMFESRPFTIRSLRHGNYINNSALMRRELLEQLGGYKEEMDFGYEDWELYLALAAAGAKFRYYKLPLLYYRRHESVSRDKAARVKLAHAHQTVRKLHPRLFTIRQKAKDILHDIITIHQRRTPLQVLKDSRYLLVNKLDKLSKDYSMLNKVMGFLRLLLKGDIGVVWDKIKLNIRRALNKVEL